MQTTVKLLDDIAKVGASILGLAFGVKDEIKSRIKSRADHFARDMNLVSRDEFEVVRSMAQRAREENIEINKRLTKLEKKPTKTVAKKK